MNDLLDLRVVIFTVVFGIVVCAVTLVLLEFGLLKF